MIKETVNEYRFTDVLLKDEYASWSYGATKALFDYYEQLSDDIGEDIELDPVAIRCEWNEYATILDAVYAYNEDFDTVADTDDGDAIEDVETKAREWLEERTTVLDVTNVDTSAGTHKKIKSVLVREF